MQRIDEDLGIVALSVMQCKCKAFTLSELYFVFTAGHWPCNFFHDSDFPSALIYLKENGGGLRV